MARERVSIVLPFFNEEGNLPLLWSRLSVVLESTPCEWECVFVNDGSTDGSEAFLRPIAESGRLGVRLVNLSRNFGHQAAVSAGMHFSTGGAVVVMDTDLQDRPEAIPALLDEWRKGFHVVYAVRKKRKENAVKRFLFKTFYRVLARLSEIPIPMEAGLFCIMDRRVVDVVTACREKERYVPGLRAWAGFRQTGLEVERDRRGDDRPRVSLFRLFKLAADAVFSFSRIPLRIATILGVLAALSAFGGIGFVLYHKLFTGKAISGWTSTMVSIFFFGAVQLISIGIMGEYLGRIYEEVKRRPPFVVRDVAERATTSSDGCAPRARTGGMPSVPRSNT